MSHFSGYFHCPLSEAKASFFLSLWLRLARVTCLTRGVLATVVFVGSLGIPHFLQFEGAQFQFNPETSKNWIFAKMQNGIKKKRKSFECVLFALWLSAFSRKIWTDNNTDKQTNGQIIRHTTQSNFTHKSQIGEFWHIKAIQWIWKLTFFKTDSTNIPTRYELYHFSKHKKVVQSL